MKIKIGIVGCHGKMGLSIARLAEKSEEFEIAGVVESPGFIHIHKNYREITGMGAKQLVIQGAVMDISDPVDVFIDFSDPKGTLENLSASVQKNIPYVIGTTGFNEEQTSVIHEASKKIPVILSPNMSLGVNVLFLAAEMITKILGESSDIEIIEAHHNNKKDSPSGTAVRLFEIIRNVLNRSEDCARYGRQGIVGERDLKEIGIHCVRGGDIVGEHQVLFAGVGEQLELVHRAQNRDTFAAGALKCAAFLVGKKPGLYNMKSVLGLE